MTQPSDPSLLPHHRLRAYSVAVQLLMAVRAARIRDRVLRDQALRAAKSACLNCAEGAGRLYPGADFATGGWRTRALAIAPRSARSRCSHNRFQDEI